MLSHSARLFYRGTRGGISVSSDPSSKIVFQAQIRRGNGRGGEVVLVQAIRLPDVVGTSDNKLCSCLENVFLESNYTGREALGDGGLRVRNVEAMW